MAATEQCQNQLCIWYYLPTMTQAGHEHVNHWPGASDWFTPTRYALRHRGRRYNEWQEIPRSASFGSAVVQYAVISCVCLDAKKRKQRNKERNKETYIRPNTTCCHCLSCRRLLWGCLHVSWWTAETLCPFQALWNTIQHKQSRTKSSPVL